MLAFTHTQNAFSEFSDLHVYLIGLEKLVNWGAGQLALYYYRPSDLVIITLNTYVCKICTLFDCEF